MVKPKCVHYWKVDNNDIGTCIYCGDAKDFGAILRKGNRIITSTARKVAKQTGERRGRKRKVKDFTDFP